MQEVIRQKRRDAMKVIKLIIMVILAVIVWAVVTLAAMMLFGKFIEGKKKKKSYQRTPRSKITSAKYSIDGWSLKDTPTATSLTKAVVVGATQ